MTEKTSWLADGVEKIAELTKASQNVVPKVMNLEHEKEGTYALVVPGPAGTKIEDMFEERLAGPDWHKEQLTTPGELSQFIRSLQQRAGLFNPPSAGAAVAADKVQPGIILVERDAARFFYSFEDRRDVAYTPLTVSEPWKWLSAPTKAMNQRDLIRVLRITFAGCLPTSSNIVSVFRNLKFNNTGQVEANIQRGNEQLGRRITNEVAGVADLPEEVTLTVPVYENYAKRVNVRVAIEVNAEAGLFELIAFPNELESGRQETLRAIRDDVQFDSDVPAFLGSNQAN